MMYVQCVMNIIQFPQVEYVYFYPECIKENDKGVCIKCSMEYTINGEGLCELDSNCKEVDEEGKCINCKNGSTKIFTDDGQLICSKYENKEQPTDYCNSCSSYETIVSYGYCAQNSFCLEVDNECHCTKCKTGYTMNSEYICKYNPNCEEMDNNTKCIKCKEQYTLFEDICLEDKGCIEWNKEHKCIQCKDNYSMNTHDFTCMFNPDCLEKNNESVCIKCPRNRGVDLYGNCENDEHCDGVNEEGHCNLCKDGYSEFKGKCSLYNEFCDEQDEKGHCIKCKDGYTINYKNGLCKIDGYCLEYNNKRECIQCSDGYSVYYKDGECHLNEFCVGYDEKGYCNECDYGYVLNHEDGNCFKDDHCSKIANSICTKCSSFYTLDFHYHCVRSNESVFYRFTSSCIMFNLLIILVKVCMNLYTYKRKVILEKHSLLEYH